MIDTTHTQRDQLITQEAELRAARELLADVVHHTDADIERAARKILNLTSDPLERGKAKKWLEILGK